MSELTTYGIAANAGGAIAPMSYSIVDDYTRAVGVVIVVHHERRRATGTPCDRRLHCHTPA
jgi:hypothetical protein